MTISLEQAKLHLRIDSDSADEDRSIQGMIDAATAAAMDYLNWTETPDTLPAPVVAAILLQVGDLYANRESRSATQLYRNQTYERLLAPYRLMDL